VSRGRSGGPPLRELALAAFVVVLALVVLAVLTRDGSAPPREASRPVNPPPSPIITPLGQPESGPANTVPAAQLTAARRVARRFLAGYLGFLYGRGSSDEITDVMPAVSRELKRNTPRIPPAQRDRTPRVVDLSAVGQARNAVIVTASIDDGDVAVYPIVFTLDRRDGLWLVSRLATD